MSLFPWNWWLNCWLELRNVLLASLQDKVATLRDDAWIFGEEVEVVDDQSQ
jgi:hypothetical protein